MSKKFTIIFYESSNFGKTRTLMLSKNLIIGILVLLSFVFMSSIILFTLNHKYSKEIASLKLLTGENIDLMNQISNYYDQLDKLNLKLASLDKLEYKVRDFISESKDESVLRPVSVGGKEIDTMRDYYAVSDRREKEFFSNLSSSLDKIDDRIDVHNDSLTELTQYLEEKNFIMLSTPTIWPTRGWVSSKFGFRTSPFSGRRVFHEGLDIAARYGIDVRATAKGVVVFSGTRTGYGYIVTIDHGYGYLTRYAHNSALLVKVGDKVEKGTPIAKVGSSGNSTGPHVHYEVLSNGIPVNPIKYIVEEGY